MIINEQIFTLKIIDEASGDFIYEIPPQQVVALKMKRIISGIGNLTFTTPFIQSIWELFKIDRLVEVYTINQSTGLLEKEETFFMRKSEIYYENELKQIAFSCVGLVDLLKRRVTVPTNNDNLNAGGFITRSGVVGDVLGEFVDEQMTNPDDTERRFPNVFYQKVDDGNVVGIRNRYENLLKVFEELKVHGDIEFDIVRDGNDEDLTIKVGKLGVDRTYKTNFPSSTFLTFSPNIGNISNPSATRDYTNIQNSIFVLGEGEGSNQYILNLVGNGLTDSVYNRIEEKIESRKGEGNNLSAGQQALSLGLKKISDSKELLKFNFELLPNRLGYIYNVDFFVGDFVTFYWDGISIDFQIKSSTLTVSGNDINRSIELELKS